MHCNQVVFHIITGCTHNCRLCVSGVPYYKALRKSYTVSLPDAKNEIDAVFQLFSFIERITVTGGEPLLHPQLKEILEYLMRYSDQFGECRIFTNGSLFPDEELIRQVEDSGGKLSFVVNDYGTDLSPRANDIKARTNCRVNSYHGDAQYFDGWVDYGPLDQRHSDQESDAMKIISSCHFTEWKMYNIFQGKLFYCTRAAVGMDLGFFTLKPEDYVDLKDQTLTLEEKRRRITRLGSFPTEACYYCAGFDTKNSVRYPAAEQVDGGDNHD